MNNSSLNKFSRWTDLKVEDPENIDALNSKAQCIKNTTPAGKDFFP